MSRKGNVNALEQRLLFHYWSYCGRKNKKKIKNLCQSDLYLSDKYSSLSLYGLSAIIDKQNCIKALEENKENEDKQIFVVDATKCWKRIVEYISTHSGSVFVFLFFLLFFLCILL